MSRTTPARQHVDGPPWMMLGAIAAVVAAGGIVWAGGTATALATGSGDDAPPFTVDAAITLVTDGPVGLWPATTPQTVWATSVVLALLVAAVVAVVTVKWTRRRHVQEAGTADRRDMAGLAPKAAAARARQLRPSLAGQRNLDPGDVGLPLGLLAPRGPQLRASWEDVTLAIMAPRAGKTTALAVPAVLDAPGAVVATSNKADLWTATSTLRADAGPVWTFDPQSIAGHREPGFWWNPLAQVTSIAAADRLAGHFMTEVQDDGRRDFWVSAGQDLLTALFLAAGVGAKSVADVYRWLSNPVTDEPADLLAAEGHLSTARSLEARRQGAPETRDGIYENARTAAQALRDDRILAWVTPPRVRSVPQLDVDDLVNSTGTLYLMSKDGAGAARPLVAALVDATFRAAVGRAERAGGRLDPPMTAVLDEAANICRIGDLPDLYSHLGSRGIAPLTILQSYRQGVRVWGEAGMDTLWSASTIKIVGAGIDDPRLLDDLSKMVGEREVQTRSTSYGRHGAQDSWSTRKEAILPADQIRAMPRGQALLLATGARVARLQLAPWFDGPRADEIAAAQADAVADITAGT